MTTDFDIPLFPGTVVRFIAAGPAMQQACAAMFAVSPSRGDVEVILRVEFQRDLSVNDGSIATEVGVLAPDGFFVFDRHGRLAEVLLEQAPAARLRVDAHVSTGFFIPNALLPSLQVAFGARGSFVHAAAVCGPEDACLLLPAWGGVGKTSSLLELSLRHGWGILADDLALIDRQGTVHPFIRTVNVLDYNVTDFPVLKRHFSAKARAAALFRRFAAALHRVSYRMSGPDSFVPSALGRLAQLAKAVANAKVPVAALTPGAAPTSARLVTQIVLLRRTVSTRSESPLSAEEAASGLLATLEDEFQKFARAEHAACALGYPRRLGAWRARTIEVLSAALAGRPMRAIGVPPAGRDPSLVSRLMEIAESR